MTDDQLPWNGEQSPSWGQAVDAWRWYDDGDGEWSKSGECPRCSHGITVLYGTSVVTALDLSEDSRLALMVGAEPPDKTANVGQQTTFARCNCGEPHPGRPGGLSSGCGSCAYIASPPADE